MKNVIRISLGILLLIVCLNAIGGGWYGLAGAESVPQEWLEGSPFHTYLIPSLILLFVVGGSTLFSSIAVFRNARIAPQASLLTGLILLGWIVTQLLIIGYVSWMQPAIFGAAIIILLLGGLLFRFSKTSAQ